MRGPSSDDGALNTSPYLWHFSHLFTYSIESLAKAHPPKCWPAMPPCTSSSTYASSSESRNFMSGVENPLLKSYPSMIVCLQAIRFIVFASVGLFGSFPSQVLPYWCHPCSWSGFDRGHHRRVRPVTEVSQSLLYEGMFISLALVLASLDNTSTLVFCSLGMCDISIESKLSILFMTVTRYFYRRASFICVSPLLRKPPAENPSSLELLGRLGLELGRALVSQLCTLPGCWSPRIQTRRIIRPSILLCFQG